MAPITISRIRELNKLSPSNFNEALIERKRLRPLRSFLDVERPYDKGIEPGRGAYNPVGDKLFMRNRCIDARNVTPHSSGFGSFVGPAAERARVRSRDILLCKDANIGEACLYIGLDERPVYFSSGIVRLNFKDDVNRLTCLALIRSSYFRHQLDAMTPRGSTIRHAGEAFLDCLLPDFTESEVQQEKGLAAAIQNIAYCEILSDRKIGRACAIFRNALFAEPYIHENPRVGELLRDRRVDAGFYSQVVKRIEAAIERHQGGAKTIEQFGYRMKRGPNLQRRDMGRSVQKKTASPGYHALVYPSDISDRGYVDRISYIGARSLVWHISEGSVLFSAEGTVGRTFAVCGTDVPFITNIHGLIFAPIEEASISNSAYLCMYFHFLKREGYFDKVSVGGQGGSFAVGYWQKVRVPQLEPSQIAQIAKLYSSGADVLDPEICDLKRLRRAGVYELNRFRMRCSDYIEKVCDDIHSTA